MTLFTTYICFTTEGDEIQITGVMQGGMGAYGLLTLHNSATLDSLGLPYLGTADKQV